MVEQWGARSSTTSSTKIEAAYTPPASINPTGVAFDPVKNWA